MFTAPEQTKAMAPEKTLAYFKPAYIGAGEGSFDPLFRDNIDAPIINVGHDSLSPYKLVTAPVDDMMDAL